MRIGIVGLPRSGKTTLLGALTGFSAADAGYAREANRATVPVPEPRLDRLFEIFKPAKKTPATIEFLDLPGIERTRPGTKSDAAQVLAAVRQVDCLLLVVRAFDRADAPHPAGSVDPERDLAELRTELTVADLEVLQGRLEKIATRLKKPVAAEREELEAEKPVLEEIVRRLESGTPLADLAVAETVEKRIKSYGLLRRKPEVVVVNLQDSEIPSAGRHEAAGGADETPRIALSAEAEREILRLEPADRPVFLAEFKLERLSIDRVVRACYTACGYISFFTGGGPDEVRAWTLRQGATAVDAAAAIHTDLAVGFIRGEVVSFADLDRCGDIKAAKAHGVWRLEGKEYRVADGDVITIRFSKG
ncbi:MAG: redox-regulated ATPase YchF [Planctomycetes bacterium]|nr:redox-regulated ATPase YchF [Planctomycetota bacterium]